MSMITKYLKFMLNCDFGVLKFCFFVFPLYRFPQREKETIVVFLETVYNSKQTNSSIISPGTSLIRTPYDKSALTILRKKINSKHKSLKFVQSIVLIEFNCNLDYYILNNIFFLRGKLISTTVRVVYSEL